MNAKKTLLTGFAFVAILCSSSAFASGDERYEYYGIVTTPPVFSAQPVFFPVIRYDRDVRYYERELYEGSDDGYYNHRNRGERYEWNDDRYEHSGRYEGRERYEGYEGRD